MSRAGTAIPFDTSQRETEERLAYPARRTGVGGLLDALRRQLYASPLYPFTLIGPPPDRILGTPPELWPGDAEAGRALVAGVFTLAGRQLELPDMGEAPARLDEAQRAALHGFAWLGDLRALGSAPARDKAVALTDAWLSANESWSPLAWRADILGDRVVAWLTHFGFFAAGADPAFRNRLFVALGRQTKHLSRALRDGATGIERLRGLKGLIYAGLALPGRDRLLETGQQQTQGELTRLILPDGGINGRSPSQQLALIRHLVEIRNAMTAAHVTAPGWLDDAVKRTVPLLRTLRHGDGGLALFHGAVEEGAAAVDGVLRAAGVRTRAVVSATHSGYHRVAAGRTLLIVDTGRPPPGTLNRWGHAGTLAFEMSVGRDRMIVNCGAERGGHGEWRHALRATAAHSTVVVDDVNSSELNSAGGFFRAPRNVTASRREIEGSVIIEGSQDGYESNFGITHRRLLMIGPEGDDLQGEDNLIGAGGAGFAIRFHLHPSVQATLLSGGGAALLRLRGGTGWRFSCPGVTVDLADSVYAGASGRIQRSKQIVVAGPLDGAGATVKWRLTRTQR